MLPSSARIRLVDALRPCSVAGSCKWAGQSALMFCAAIALLEFVVERGEQLNLPPHSRIVVIHFAEAVQCLMTRESGELGSATVAAWAFERRTILTGFDI